MDIGYHGKTALVTGAGKASKYWAGDKDTFKKFRDASNNESSCEDDMDIVLTGKTSLVTGAGKGIGRAIAKKLSECGAKVIALSRTQADLDSLKIEVPDIQIINVDLQDWNKTREELENIGAIDLLVNNAGIAKGAPFVETSKDVLDSMVDINFKAVYNVSQEVSRNMVENDIHGSIVNISSIGSTMAIKNYSAGCCAKAALDMLTKCMALELGPHKIRVNSVNPTIVWTDAARKFDDSFVTPLLEKTPLGKFAGLEDVVNAVIFLLSDRSAMITGECIKVDGGACVH